MSKKKSIAFVNQFIGLPWSEEFNCFWLARTIALERDCEVPSQHTAEGHLLREKMLAGEMSLWLQPLLDPEPWCWILWDLKSFGLHVGTMIDVPGKFIHVGEFTKTSRIDRLKNKLYKRPYGYYRLINPLGDAAGSARPD